MSAAIVRECSTPLLTRTPTEILTTHRGLTGALDEVRQREDQDVIEYRLQRSPYMDVGAVLLLIYVGLEAELYGWKVKASGSSDAMKTLVRHLNSLWAGPARKSLPHEVGEFSLRDIPNQQEMVIALDEWASGLQKESKATEEQADLWQFQISEVVTNSFQHGFDRQTADQPRLFVAGQFIQSTRQVQLAVLDFGATIPATIWDSHTCGRPVAVPLGPACLRRDRCDGALISHACCHRVTSKSVKENQGAGLYSLVETVKHNRGRLQILSRNGFYHVNGLRGYARNLPRPSSMPPFLSGTLTTVLFNLRAPNRVYL